MSRQTDEPVRVAAGSAIEMELLKQQLADAGITATILGDVLDGGIGTAIPGSVELYVPGSLEERTREIVAGADTPDPERPKFPHPQSDSKPG